MTRFLAHPTFRCGSTLVWLLALTACVSTSPAPHVVALADTQHGIDVTVRMLGGEEHRGELLSASDTAFVLLLSQRVAIARLAAVHSVDFGDASPDLVERGTFSADVLDRARGSARFPFGIPPRAMTMLLQRAGQDTPLELRAGVP